MPLARYLTHPQVVVDPARDVRDWGLNATGHARVAQLAQSSALAGTTRVISSAETKALETALPLAAALGCEVEIRAAMQENDRSATGYLQPADFGPLRRMRFFAKPADSFRGWETANSARDRIVAEVEASLTGHESGDVLFAGHGAVGTCALVHAVRGRDQPKPRSDRGWRMCFHVRYCHAPPASWMAAGGNDDLTAARRAGKHMFSLQNSTWSFARPVQMALTTPPAPQLMRP